MAPLRRRGANCADIAGASAQTYTLAAADVGHTIRVQVSATNGAGTVVAASAATAAVAAIPPANTGSPAISGTAHDGETLSDRGTWSGSEPLSYSYQWRRCDAGGAGCADIAGATAQDYELVTADVGSTVRLHVTASNAGGSASAGSEPTAAAVAAPPRT